ncbi:ATP-binding protein [Streptomyces sp. NPDC056304]|uniref:ATP-binding protein n=1 Tax=Streptomyces sp. NPDC056304 TaxID=3345778 RepID=UPI0035E13A24
MTATATHTAPIGPPQYGERYAADSAAPAEARHHVGLALAAWDLDHVTDTARLVVSELLTNALAHTNSPVIDVSVTRTSQDTVRVTVTDTSCRTLPATAPLPGPDAESGRGLVIVASIARAWGSELVNGGKQVWVDLDTSRPAR